MPPCTPTLPAALIGVDPLPLPLPVVFPLVPPDVVLPVVPFWTVLTPLPRIANPTPAGFCLKTVYTFFKNASPTTQVMGDPEGRSIAKKAPVHWVVSRVNEPRLKSVLDMA